MTSQFPNRVYLNPPKFWAATKEMSAADVEQLTSTLMRLAAEERFEELEKYEFISIGHPHAA